MTNDQLRSVGEALQNVAATFKEFCHQSHPSMGGVAPFGLLNDCLGREAGRIRAEGHTALADGLEALRAEIGVMDNG